jgi:nitroimidazol reductase NimA-like FMN-containing flavoprotein (pyridoxamine 5'-phosphate oxidase superfamily)
MIPTDGALETIRTLIASEPLAVLATIDGSVPCANLVAIARDDEDRALFFATSRYTRKYANLCRNPRVALLIDNRKNDASDFRDAAAVTVIGTAVEVGAEAREAMESRYVTIHPSLADFVRSPTTVLYRIAVEKYIMVTRFQHVVEVSAGDGLDPAP